MASAVSGVANMSLPLPSRLRTSGAISPSWRLSTLRSTPRLGSPFSVTKRKPAAARAL